MYQSTPIDYLTFIESLSRLKVDIKLSEVSFYIYSIICSGHKNPTNELIGRFCKKQTNTIKKHIPKILSKAIFLNHNETGYSRTLISFFPTNTSAIAKLIYVNHQDKCAIFSWRVPEVGTLLNIWCLFDEEEFEKVHYLKLEEYYYFCYSSLQKINLFEFKVNSAREFISIDKLNLSIAKDTGNPTLQKPNL